MSQTSDIRLSNNAYLLFYERKLLSTKNPSFFKSLTTPATCWFSANVPRSVQTYCEEQRCYIRNNLENKAENLCYELDNYTINNDQSLIKPIHSGISTFYTPTSVNSSSNLLNGNLNSYLPNRRNSISSKPYASPTNESKKPINYYCNSNNVKSPLKSYCYESIESYPSNKLSKNYLLNSRQSLYQNHQQALDPSTKFTSTRYINTVNGNNNAYLSGYNSNTKYLADTYSTLPSSTKRSKSYQTFSNTALHSKSGTSYNVSSPYFSGYLRNLNNNPTNNNKFDANNPCYSSHSYADNSNKNLTISYRR